MIAGLQKNKNSNFTDSNTEKSNRNHFVYLNLFVLILAWVYLMMARECIGVFQDEIKRTLHINADKLSNLTALLLLVYSFLQIPFGILIDKIGLRKVLLSSFLLALIGHTIFAFAKTYYIACFARILSGIGSVPLYICLVDYISNNFSKKTCGFMISFAFAIETIMSMILTLLSKYTALIFNNWRLPIMLMNFIGLFVFICMFIFFKFNNLYKQLSSISNFWKSLIKLVLNYKIYIYGLCALGSNTLVCVISDLWGPAFIAKKYMLTQMQSVSYSQFIYAGFLVGSLLTTLIFNGDKIMIGVRICLACLAGVLFAFAYGTFEINKFTLQIMLLLLGIFGSVDILIFALVANNTPYNAKGLTISFLNTITMVGGPILHKIIGESLNKYSFDKIDLNGLCIYSVDCYEHAMKLLMFIVLFCLAASFFLRKNQKTKKFSA